MDHDEIDSMWAEWAQRMTPQSEELRFAQMNDSWHHAHMELMRRYAHIYEEAMCLEGISDESRKRVLSMVLLGSPDGTDALARQRLQDLYKDALATLQAPASMSFPET